MHQGSHVEDGKQQDCLTEQPQGTGINTYWLYACTTELTNFYKPEGKA